MKIWDAIVVGAGIIGLSLAIELNRRGLRVLIVEKGEPGREASWAAGGMLADFPFEMPSVLRGLATASAGMYPEFVHALEDESRMKIDLRDQGALVFVDSIRDNGFAADWGHDSGVGSSPRHSPAHETFHAEEIDGAAWRNLEPDLNAASRANGAAVYFLKERSVDPRELTAAAIAAAKHRGIDFSSGDQVLAIEVADGKTAGVRTNKTRFAAGIVVNCAGAWAGQIGFEKCATARESSVQVEQNPADFLRVPTRPVKGQMLCVIMPDRDLLRHTIRTPDVYLIPRSDGRLLIGATQEEAGFDKQTVPETIQKLRQHSLNLVPNLADARFLQAWAGLRPGTPDKLPILGATAMPGYFVATGHFRDGILLAPVTARVMGQVIAGENPAFDLAAFAARRFQS